MERRTPLGRGKPLTGGKPLARGKPLSAGTPLTARKPLDRGTGPSRSSKAATSKPRARRSSTSATIPAEVRDLVLGRCLGLCEACGQPLGATPAHLHHRLLRSAGGPDAPQNLVALHPTCHVLAPEAVHQRPAWAHERGLMVRRGADPADVPLRLPTGELVKLTDTARYDYAPAA